MKKKPRLLVTGSLATLALSACVETDAALFAAKVSPPPVEGGTFMLTETASIVNGRVAGDCETGGCGWGDFGLGAAVVGDLDSDGHADIAIPWGVYRADSHDRNRGAIVLMYGRSTWADEETVEPDAIIEMELGHGSRPVARAGDVDGDGHADFLVGDPGGGRCSAETYEPGSGQHLGQEERGRAYLVHGGPDRLTGIRTISEVASTFEDDEPCLGLGGEVASAGDLDGDGYGDFVLGANLPPATGVTNPPGVGRAHLFYGGPERRPARSSISTADATLRGRPDATGFGKGLTVAGDVDGDGDSELLISENEDRTWNLNGQSVAMDAASYLVAGGARLAGDVDATTAPGISTFGGPRPQGMRATDLGDLDEDGLDDFGITGWGPDVDDVFAFVFYGRVGGFGSSVEVDDADVLIRRDPGDPLTFPLDFRAAGDRDGDGHRDVVFGHSALEAQGGVYVVSGTGGRWTGEFFIGDISAKYIGSEAPVFDPQGPSYLTDWDRAGLSIDGDGDVDGDGKADLITTSSAGGLGRLYILR